MQAIELLRFGLIFPFERSKALAHELDDMALTPPTVNGGNHALWVYGHLATVEALFCTMITGEPSPLAAWEPLFGPGTEPMQDPTAYPPFPEVREKFHAVREQTLQLLERVGNERLSERPKVMPPPLEGFIKTNGDAFQLIAMHQMSHFGQIADCRRAAGRKWRF